MGMGRDGATSDARQRRTHVACKTGSCEKPESGRHLIRDKKRRERERERVTGGDE